jgi:hydrogenase maturation protease
VIPRILIAGVGNVLLEDDGFGPHAIARLEAEYELGAEVELIDIGTPGLDFVDYLVGRDALIILDAVSSGGEPGEILTCDRQQLREFMPNMRLSAHQPCLQETLFAAETADVCPPDVLLVGVVGESFEVSTALSDVVQDAMPVALEFIAEQLRQRGVPARKRLQPLPCNPWWSVSDLSRPA